MTTRRSDFKKRVDYAEKCFLEHQTRNNRAFDRCFEMFDGKAVVIELMRRAAADTALDYCIREAMRGCYEEWQELYAKNNPAQSALL